MPPWHHPQLQRSAPRREELHPFPRTNCPAPADCSRNCGNCRLRKSGWFSQFLAKIGEFLKCVDVNWLWTSLENWDFGWKPPKLASNLADQRLVLNRISISICAYGLRGWVSEFPISDMSSEQWVSTPEVPDHSIDPAGRCSRRPLGDPKI